MNRIINVRCCCIPGLILGAIQLPDDPVVGRRYSWLMRRWASTLREMDSDIGDGTVPVMRITMELREFMGKEHRRELAFHSNNYAVAELRDVREFAEVCVL